jgi:hypothetical protein
LKEGRTIESITIKICKPEEFSKNEAVQRKPNVKEMIIGKTLKKKILQTKYILFQKFV